MVQIAEQELARRWAQIKLDREGKSALAKLDKAGFHIQRVPLGPRTWPAAVAVIPSLPNKRGASAPENAPLLAVRTVVRWLERLANRGGTGKIAEARHRSTIYMDAAPEICPKRLLAAAHELLELSGMRWVMRNPNVQRNATASLRWEVRNRCNRPMEIELNQLIGAAFRAAGKRKPANLHIEKCEQTECASRVNVRKKLRSNSDKKS